MRFHKRLIVFDLLLLCFLTALVLLFSLNQVYPTSRNRPTIQNGVLKIQNCSSKLACLHGTWMLYWDQWIVSEPDVVQEGALVHVPSRLPGVNSDYHAGGICSYRLTVQTTGALENMVLHIPHIGTAYVIYVDGTPVCQNGIVSRMFEERLANDSIKITPFTLTGEQEIVIEAAFQESGGIYMTPMLVSKDIYDTFVATKRTLSTLTLGMVLSFVALFAMLHFFASRDQYSLWLPVLIILIFLRKLLLDDSMGTFTFLTNSISFDALNNQSIIATILSKSALFLFLFQLLDMHISRRGILLIALFYIGLYTSYVTLPLDLVVGHFMPFYVYAFYIPDIYVISRMRQAVKENTRFSCTLTFVFLLYIFGVIVDCSYISGLFLFDLSWVLNICILIVVLLAAFIYCKKMNAISQQARLVAKLENEIMQSNVSLLLSQIQPHFIYNALTSIRYLCKNNPQKAEESIIDFANYLRCNMASLGTRWVIPFKEELMHVKSYIAIEKIRFEEKLQIELDIQADDFEVPALCVEPLVENAIKHGVRGRISGGKVTIKTFEEDGYNVVLIIDDGVGFDPTQIKETSVGISNITKRLSLIQGVLFDIQSEPGNGTTASIRFPIEKRGGS